MSALADLRVEPARRVRIAVPAYTGMEADTERSIVEGCKALVAAGIEVQDFDAEVGCCYVDYARNKLVARFLDSAATDLIFIDADVGFEPDTLLRLCQTTHPLAAGIYPKKIDPVQWPVLPTTVQQNGVTGVWLGNDGMVDCDFVPTGFMRINRAVFSHIVAPGYWLPDLQKMAVAYFQCVVTGGEYVGEDVEFCRRWQRAGGIVRAFADMDLRHSYTDKEGVTHTWRGNWGQWLREQAPERKAA